MAPKFMFGTSPDNMQRTLSLIKERFGTVHRLSFADRSRQSTDGENTEKAWSNNGKVVYKAIGI